MTKTLMGLLLAATALVPGMASAQDAGVQDGRQRPDMRQVRERALRVDGDGDRQPRRFEQRRAEQPRADVQVNTPVTGDRGDWRGGDRRGVRQDRQDRQEGRPTWAENRAQQPQGETTRQPFADRRDDRRDDRADRRDDRRTDRADRRGDRRDDIRSNGGRPDIRTWQSGQNGQNVRRWQGDGGDQRRIYDRARAQQQWSRNGADWRDNDRNRNGFDDRRSWNRSWRNDDRYDWNGYRAQNRGQYRLPRYYAPQGWGNGYRRFSVGLRLESILFNQNYWIQDPWTYRLPEAYGPYRWVRYYDDALLVDLDSGRVIDTVYGIFW
ncbi:hypothetical protein ASE75_01625 [Sphingomonas sp. Leaf17]|uniref:RcnB family protein n=1 Tax=Sphingomonas sp. Leaf17 TaxID=1735683 RepID=UPI00070190F4|nr:RcnB family protein [Sphingomonas sp. Leaf17]KQM67657.1 hypothetical protein ASE75_01625 [Sphingomonas sp. Leaf17]